MTLKQYKYWKLAIVIILASGISTLTSTGNYLLPLVAALLAWVIMYNLRQHVDGILADERDYAMAGQSARYTLGTASVFMMIAFFVLMHFSKQKPELYAFAMILSYLVLAMMLLNVAIFHFLKTKAKIDKPGFMPWLKAYGKYILLALLFALIFSAGSVRLFSGEDSWICDNGEWVKHGNPTAPKPTVACTE